MQNITPEQIQKRYSSLAKPLQDAFFSTKTDDTVSKTCVLREIEIHVRTIAKLTGRVLIGYLRPENFVAEIQKETGVSEMTAQLVAHDIDGEIFSNVRLELKKLYPPVIQTPTVQSWKQESRIANQESRKADEIPAKPKYVIPIPEKFRGQDLRFKNQDLRIEEPGIKNYESRIMNHETEKKIPEPTPPVQENVKSTQSMIQDSRFKIQESPKPQPEFKPIVPLPTFIRSQFKMEEPKKAASAENQKIEAKDFIGKFSAPDQTLAKPTPSKEDQYREKI